MKKKSDATQILRGISRKQKEQKKRISIEGCLESKPSVEKKDKKSQHLGLPGVNTKPLKENANNNFINQAKCTNIKVRGL